MTFGLVEAGPYYRIWGKLYHPLDWMWREQEKPKWKRW